MLFGAGLAGGATVIAVLYGYYHFSGVKKLVDTSKSTQEYLQRAKDSMLQNAPKNPNEALAFLRGVAKNYASVIPGAGAYVDSSFDMLDELHDTHRDELDRILQGTYEEVKGILKDVSDKGLESLDMATVGKLMNVLRKRVGEINGLARRAGSDAFSRFEQRYPQVGQTLGSSYAELHSLAMRSGPEAKRLSEDAMKQVQDILSAKSSSDAVERAKEVLTSKTRELKSMLWHRASEETKKYPELHGLLEENKDAFMQAEVSSGTLKEVLEWVKEVTSGNADLSKEKLNEARDYLRNKAQGMDTLSLEGLQKWLERIPGSEEARKHLPVDIKALVQVTQKRGEEAKELARETFRDVHKVLQEKAEKARQLGEEGKEEHDAKSSKSS
ncbi:hypothetical protein EIP86_003367 [Pleurotus ostreatoroseus]|nr:hypothetical protein EIP86_003367 [Pleurotus ostreatoroseus]